MEKWAVIAITGAIISVFVGVFGKKIDDTHKKVEQSSFMKWAQDNVFVASILVVFILFLIERMFNAK